MIKNLQYGDSFCVLPWIENFTNMDGQKYFCCWSSIPLESNENEIRQQIWDGKKVPHCTECYELEKNKVVSPRQRENSRWLRDLDIKEYFTTEICPSPKSVFFDFRPSNKCNLACIGCNPKDSSLWAKELSIPIVNKTNNLDTNKILEYKKIYMAGGEPFLINECINVIKLISDKNPDIELVINTNLTTVPEEIFIAIKKIKKVNITVSLDSYGTINEYHRYPMKWDKFIRNLENLKETGVSISFNTVIDAVSVFGFDKLHLLENFANNWSMVLLTHPSALCIKNIPDILKPQATEKLKTLKDIKFYKTDIHFKTRIDDALISLNKKGNSSELSAYIQTLDQRRNLNHRDFLGVNLIET